MATPQWIIKRFMGALDYTGAIGEAAVDLAVKTCSNYNSTQEVINSLVVDCRNYNAADPVNGWKSFLYDKCGIILDNEDTGAITGYDAGGSTIKTAESIVPESGSLIYFTGNSFTTNGATFTLEKDFWQLNDDERFMWQCLYTWWAREALNLIDESYGYSFYDLDATVRDITVKFVNDSSSDAVAQSISYSHDDSTAYYLSLNINEYYFNNFDKTNFNGKSTGTTLYLDRTIAHEFTHLLMSAKILYEDDLPIFIGEGMAELTRGVDDIRYSLINSLAKNADSLRDNLNIQLSKGNVDSSVYAAGYIFLRYLAKQASLDTREFHYTRATGNEGNRIVDYNVDRYIILGALPTAMTFYNDDFYCELPIGTRVVQNAMNKYIDLRDGARNEFIKACALTYSGTIDGRDKNGFDYFVGSNYGSDTIYAGDGGSSLWGGSGNYDDNLIGGAGTDIFVSGKYQGNDVLTNVSSADEILLTDATMADLISVNEGDNTIAFTFSTGNILLIGDTELLSAKIHFADGATRRFNHATRSWQYA